jgi:hypothetical protein
MKPLRSYGASHDRRNVSGDKPPLFRDRIEQASRSNIDPRHGVNGSLNCPKVGSYKNAQILTSDAIDLSLTGADDCGGQLRIIGYSSVGGRTPMHEPRKVTIRRRNLLLAVVAAGAAAGGAAAALGAASVPPADAVRRRDKRKPQYRADSPEVQTFYRVNRYPAK